MFSTDDYLVPTWSAAPTAPAFFEIIRNGTYDGELPVKMKDFNLVGRNEELCDIYIDNPSISRKHAIIQFKKDQSYPLLFDLGSSHGTEVNRQKLPPRIYHPIKPFDTIKFGISSRMYVFRCPDLEKAETEVEEEGQNQFMEMMAEENKLRSKQEMKQQYLLMLESDPIYLANTQRRQLAGSAQNMQTMQADEGVNWGISDERETYALANENEFQIEPDVLRRLSGLTEQHLTKIAEYEQNLWKYHEVEQQLKELRSREKRDMGLQQKARDRKQKIETKFVQVSEALDKTQEWIRTQIFGLEQSTQKKMGKVKQNDTFEDDEFYDRTLVAKPQPSTVKKSDQFTARDFWKYERQLKQKLAQLQQELNAAPENHNEEQQEKDCLEAFMDENNNQLQVQNATLRAQRIQKLKEEIQQIRSALSESIGEKEADKIYTNLTSPSPLAKAQPKKEQTRVGRTLDQLEKIQESLQEELDEEDINIFKLYEASAKRVEQRRRPRPVEDEQGQMAKRRPTSPTKIEKVEQNQFFDLTTLK